MRRLRRRIYSRYFSPWRANQDANLQIWKTVGSSAPQLLWPEKKTAQTSQKIIAGQRQYISLPMESGPVTLTVRLSRVPPAPTTRHEGAMFDRLSLSQSKNPSPQPTNQAQKNALPTSSNKILPQPLRSLLILPQPVAATAEPDCGRLAW